MMSSKATVLMSLCWLLAQFFLDRMIPAFMWANSDQVAEQSLAALARNKRRIVPGAIGKMLNAVGYLPHMITSPINKLSYGALAGDNK